MSIFESQILRGQVEKQNNVPNFQLANYQLSLMRDKLFLDENKVVAYILKHRNDFKL